MKYSAGMMSVPYLFTETRKTAELYLKCNDVAALKERVLGDNLYQMTSSYRAERYFNAIIRRISVLPPMLLETLAHGSNSDAKLLVLISIMRTDLLYFEFIYEAFRGELLTGSPTFDDKVINRFFVEKAAQSETVAGWKDTTIAHLKQYYIRVLFESGILSDIRSPRRIMKPWINDRLRDELREADLDLCLYALTGEL